MNAIEKEAIEKELYWLEKLILSRIHNIDTEEKPPVLSPPQLNQEPYGIVVEDYCLSLPERICLALALAKSIKPEILAYFNVENEVIKYMAGGFIKPHLNVFVPTIKTVLFLSAGDDYVLMQEHLAILNPRNRLILDQILIVNCLGIQRETEEKEDDWINYHFRIPNTYLRYFLTGEEPRLDEDAGFPAYLATTSLNFEDITLSQTIREELEDLMKYMEVREKMLAFENVKGKVRENYIVVFSGMPGTGKSITAKTLGKKMNLPVYIVDLSRVVSKYIGETEKNLEKIFDRFTGKPCLLFFDEADALFGRRTEVKDARDRYANQETAYLLQKIEEFSGVAILATNIQDVENSLDKAFQRRIRRHIHFDFPLEDERKLLWEKALPSSFTYENGLIERLAKDYQVNGASIYNIISDTLVEAVYQNTNTIKFELLERYIKIDYKRRRVNFEACTDDQALKNPSKRFGNIYRGSF
ncbi:MAG: ATP-binding protein [Raineya sp.]|jgi:AAA+ superfamily predicted ATPase|nr:ATP-binding protein [Raineya sp.]